MEIDKIKDPKHDIYRVDQNILNSITEFMDTFGDDSDLCFIALVFFSYNKQKDIFGNYIIDVNKFSEFSNVSKSKLNGVKALTGQAKSLGPQKGKSKLSQMNYEWNTNLERALRKMTLNNIPLRNASYYDGHEIHKLKGIQILKEINVEYSPGKLKNKLKQYSYELNDQIENAMVNRWGLVDPKVYHKLSISNRNTKVHNSHASPVHHHD